MKFSKNIYNFKWWHLFVTYIVMYTGLMWLTNSLILTNSYYYSTFNQLSAKRIASVILMNKKYQWIGYVSMPISLLLKWYLIAGVIFTGLLLSNQRVLFKSCFKIVIIAELSSILGAIVKTTYFSLYEPSSMQELQFFYPLSLIQFFNIKRLPAYFIYPLQQSNLFEVAYWLLIAVGIHTHIKKPFLRSIKIVASSYGVAFFLWVLFIVFIQLQFS